MDSFFTLFQDLPQLGPGSDACTREALGRLPAPPPSPRVRTWVRSTSPQAQWTCSGPRAPSTPWASGRACAAGARCSPEAVRFWGEGYPTLGTVPENRATAEREGYGVLDTFPLPRSAWEAYSTPLLQRIERLRPTADASLREVLSETERELALHRAHGDSYGYVFFLLRKHTA